MQLRSEPEGGGLHHGSGILDIRVLLRHSLDRGPCLQLPLPEIGLHALAGMGALASAHAW